MMTQQPSYPPQSFYAARLKRVLDLAGSLILLLLTAPLQILIAGAIAVHDGWPVMYHQERAGRDGRIFRLHKFRTMTVGTHERSGGYPTAAMITRPGRTLRRLSLDEVPQLVNILVGEMSFVGPRPAIPSQVERYTPEQRGRLLVRPGLTGLAQIRHRNDAPWSRRITTDLEYIRHLSLRMDLHVLLQTIPTALKGEGQHVGQTVAEVDDLGPALTGTEQGRA
jgi:lipopolysaccharide/colanic/teichoic acid biosynthesis glycosyltransferase